MDEPTKEISIVEFLKQMKGVTPVKAQVKGSGKFTPPEEPKKE